MTEFDQILDAIAHAFSVPVEEILGRSRRRNPSEARAASMLLCRHYLKWTPSYIAERFERDISTVYVALSVASNDFCPVYRRKLKNARGRLELVFANQEAA